MDPHDEASYKEITTRQKANGWGSTIIDFKGISPIIWMNEWLKISINDFQNKRNLLYNSVDMFRNDEHRMEMFSNIEF